MKYTFGDLVIIDKVFIGVVVKCWGVSNKGNPRNYDVYVRSWNGIHNYKEDDIERYLVRHKELSEEEQEYQSNAMNL